MAGGPVPHVPFLYRRGAIYYWRRRIPGLKNPIAFSLGTPDPRLARRLGLSLASICETLFHRKGFAAMNAQQAQSFLHKVMVRYRTKFELQEMVALQGGSSWRTEHIATRAAAVAYNLLAERGKSATITRDEAQRLADEPDGDKLLEQIGQSLHFNREVLWQEGTASKLRTALAEHLERDDISAVEIDEGRRLTAKGRALAAALVSEKRQAPADLAALLAEADDVTMLNMMMAASPESIGPAAPATPSSATPRELEATAAPSPAKETFAPNIPALLEGLIAHRDEDSSLTDKTAGQMRQAVALFIEATGKQAIEDVQQADVATFVGVMKKLPKAYRKSPRDRDLPLSAFIERGRTLPVDQVGFAGATLNWNLADARCAGRLCQGQRPQGR